MGATGAETEAIGDELIGLGRDEASAALGALGAGLAPLPLAAGLAGAVGCAAHPRTTTVAIAIARATRGAPLSAARTSARLTEPPSPTPAPRSATRGRSPAAQRGALAPFAPARAGGPDDRAPSAHRARGPRLACSCAERIAAPTLASVERARSVPNATAAARVTRRRPRRASRQVPPARRNAAPAAGWSSAARPPRAHFLACDRRHHACSSRRTSARPHAPSRRDERAPRTNPRRAARAAHAPSPYP